MTWDSKLYPWQPYKTFASKEEAIVYALEIEGYRKLWEWIAVSELRGFISAN
jgi:hypothetical protein